MDTTHVSVGDKVYVVVAKLSAEDAKDSEMLGRLSSILSTLHRIGGLHKEEDTPNALVYSFEATESITLPEDFGWYPVTSISVTSNKSFLKGLAIAGVVAVAGYLLLKNRK